MEKQTITVTFAGARKINAELGSHTVYSDQSVKQGGEDSAPSPFGVFLASIAMCAGVYAQRFFEKKELSMEGFSLTVDCEYDPDPKKFRVAKMTTKLSLPDDFPEKLKAPLIRNVNACTVKKQILEPPEFETVIV